ncbi:molybdopterin-guanine dinucleotide biosynthesis protein B [Sporosarcina oncorhynchi]|uniref:Molybdopterin-guanine dinucleotide biosynthesis protein B n=1 Tax=Sporosarcina oncorhynchi TaxID=3056444 RepID=A0ABZ0L7E7_9BACL|nr:molybdopterin-guanine dinucleotide biosynthesis protein B [Sporosarcina sp. T2O-4]WOV87853.1 molybdopterin-guanine dinucleotide biosynthesis protein B [Sporosarcina sp. T2O-4]
MKTLHIVGYKNSGKTTLIARWIRVLKQRGLTVAVLKHHGHGGKPDLADNDTDTNQFLKNGANATVVAGGGAMQFIWNEEPDFLRLKEMAATGKPDILLVEGYKEERGDKVILVRDEEDWQTLSLLQGRILIIGSPDFAVDCPQITNREQHTEIDKWFNEWVEEGTGDETI